MRKYNTILDLDDFAQDAESNAMNWLVAFKCKYPLFKVTLFTILKRWDRSMLKRLHEFEFLEFAAHGYTHVSNTEVLDWDRKMWFDILADYESMGIFAKVFKAPNWEMSQLGYHVLHELGWAVAVRKEQIKDVPKGMKFYCFETNMFGVHGHTWLMKAHLEEGKFDGWYKGTQFDFVSESLEVKI